MSSWKELNPFHPVNVPVGPGVYVFLIDGLAVYVGQSMRLRERIYCHKARHGYGKNVILPWGEVSSECSVTLKVKESRRMGDWAMWEIRLIHRLQPRFNKTHLRMLRAA